MRDLQGHLLQKDHELKSFTDVNAVERHADSLRQLRPLFAKLRSHKSCMCCLLRAPEKVLPCGHAICDLCTRAFGSSLGEDKHSFRFDQCPLCGEACRVIFQLIPLTAGMRVLSLDGGGVRGVVSLMFLKRLDELIAKFELPLRDYFDFVCGTSAGMFLATLSSALSKLVMLI